MSRRMKISITGPDISDTDGADHQVKTTIKVKTKVTMEDTPSQAEVTAPDENLQQDVKPGVRDLHTRQDLSGRAQKRKFTHVNTNEAVNNLDRACGSPVPGPSGLATNATNANNANNAVTLMSSTSSGPVPGFPSRPASRRRIVFENEIGGMPFAY